jgi:hypothetical protein
MKNISLLIISLVFTNLSFELQAQQYPLGVVASDEDKQVKKASRPLGFGENLPNSVNLKKFAPFIADQGQMATAAAYASTHTAATMEWAILTNTEYQSVINAQTYDPYHTYLHIPKEDDAQSCASGIPLYFALLHLTADGSKRRFDGALSCDSEVSFEDLYNGKDKMTIEFEDFYDLTSEDDWWYSSSDNVRAALAENHPVVFALHVPTSFFDIGTYGLFTPSIDEKEEPIENSQGLHAMTIVGYDDELWDGCFIVANSWGTSWGDNGYCYIQYEDFNTFLYGAYHFQTKLKYNPMDSQGCIYGDCSEGYGVYKNAYGGIFEGQFANSIPTLGVYVNYGNRKSKFGKKYIKKLIKKNGGYLLYDNLGSKNPIGCSIY